MAAVNGALPGERIVWDPEIAFGEATVRGTRIWANLVLGLLADGATPEDLLFEYPSLSREDIDACVVHGERLAATRDEEVSG